MSKMQKGIKGGQESFHEFWIFLNLPTNKKDNTGSWEGFLCGSDSKESACNVGDLSLIPGWGRSPGEGNGYPLQYSWLEDFMERGAWQAIVHEVVKRQTQLSWELGTGYDLSGTQPRGFGILGAPSAGHKHQPILWKGLCQGASPLTPGWDNGMGLSQMLGWVHTMGIYKANTKNIGWVWWESFPTFYFIITSFNTIISEKNFFSAKI